MRPIRARCHGFWGLLGVPVSRGAQQGLWGGWRRFMARCLAVSGMAGFCGFSVQMGAC